MKAARHIVTRLRTEAAGFTLVELLIAMTVALIILGPVLNLLTTAGKSQKATTERAQAVVQGKVGLDRMVREIREAASFKLLTSQVVEIVTPVRPLTGTSSYTGNLRLVRYDCTGGHCVRFQAANKTGPLPTTGTELFTDVSNVDVFDPQPSFVNPAFIAVKVNITARNHTPINLTDGVNLRNQRFLG